MVLCIDYVLFVINDYFFCWIQFGVVCHNFKFLLV